VEKFYSRLYLDYELYESDDEYFEKLLQKPHPTPLLLGEGNDEVVGEVKTEVI
jgi:hypothetical protein